jgi:DNA-binding NtrC family response regulator
VNFNDSPLPTPLPNEVLAVGASEDDLNRLRSAFGRSSWQLHTARTADEARERLRGERIPVVLCARHLPDGDWKTVLKFADGLVHPPKLIVFSRHADDRLWAEVLNLGGFDVLDFPARPPEIFRAISSAWRNWREQSQEHSATASTHSL